MSILGNNYPNLPGMLMEFKDGGQSLRFNDVGATTESMLLLGTSVDGPVMEPVAVDEDTAELLLGSELRNNNTPNGSTLLHAAKQAFAAGCKDVRVMRISGEKAVLKINAAEKVENFDERVDESLTIVQGNDQTVLTTKAENVQLDSVKVYVKGVELKEGISKRLQGKKAEVTIAKNSCEAGASVLLKFKYQSEVSTEGEFIVNNSNKVVLPHVPVSSSVKVLKDGEVVQTEKYNVSGDTIEFIQAELQVMKKAKAARDIEGNVTAGDRVTVQFKYNEILDGNENSGEDGPFLTKTSEQTVTIKETPTEGSLILYIDDARVLDTSAYTVEGKSVKIKKERFLKGQSISVSYYVSKSVTIKNEIVLESRFAGSVYNTGTVVVQPIKDEEQTVIGTTITITKPSSKLATGELAQTYRSFDFPTFGDLVDAINENNSVYQAKTDTPNVATSDLATSNSYFENGDDGINLTKDELFQALSGVRNAAGEIVKLGAYQLLENYQTDYVVPLGVYADDSLQDRHQNFAYELALFCAAISQKNKTTYGMIAMKPLKDTSLAGIQEHAEYLKNFDNHYYMRDLAGAYIKTKDDEFIDLGKFISVVVGPTPTFSHRVSALREANPAVMYCAFNTTLRPQSAPTNKILKGTNGIKFVYSNAQLNDIVGNRMVVFGTKFARNGQTLQGCHIIDGPTAAQEYSEYARLTTCKVVRKVSDDLREVADPFIGEANTIEQRNALSAAISKKLDLELEDGVILDYAFDLSANASDLILGQAILSLEIQPPQELRKINTIVGLKRS